jgi:hypothetical protein
VSEYWGVREREKYQHSIYGFHTFITREIPTSCGEADGAGGDGMVFIAFQRSHP